MVERDIDVSIVIACFGCSSEDNGMTPTDNSNAGITFLTDWTSPRVSPDGTMVVYVKEANVNPKGTCQLCS